MENRRSVKRPGNPFSQRNKMKLAASILRIALSLGCPALALGAVPALAGALPTNQVAASKTGREEAFKLLDQYAATRNQLKTFIITSKGSEKLDAHYTAGLDTRLSGVRTLEHLEKFRFDGARYKIIQQEWGPLPLWNYQQNNPLYSFRLWDGTNGCIYQDDPRRGPGTPDPNGSRYSLQFYGYNKAPHNDFIMGASKVGYLLGYFPNSMPRIDLAFRQASAISVRAKPELVDGSPCLVVDAATKSGRGSIWLDPQHGYLIAKAEFHIRAGDLDAINRAQKPGRVTDLKIQGIRFAKLNDTWVTVAGTLETRSTWPPDGYENAVYTDEITEIIPNPDFSTLPNAFGLEDVHDGARVQLDGRRGYFVWRNGQVQPAPSPPSGRRGR